MQNRLHPLTAYNENRNLIQFIGNNRFAIECGHIQDPVIPVVADVRGILLFGMGLQESLYLTAGIHIKYITRPRCQDKIAIAHWLDAINTLGKLRDLCKLSAGMPVSEIAAELFLSVKTVSTYRARILEKMKMKNNAELTYYAIKNHLIE